MATVDVYNLKREKVSEVDLPEGVFDVPVKRHVLHQVVVRQAARSRSGTASTKSRSEVKSSGQKLWRQKGTGRARVGKASSPTRRGGGVTFGPAPRTYDMKVPKRVKRAALRMALSDKLRGNQLIVVDGLELPEIKTKDFVAVMKTFDVDKALIVTDGKSEKLGLSSRNVPGVKVMRHEGLNVYDVLRYEHLFLELGAVGKIQEALRR
jgi:large subunit ribosomal protein L4